ncbi:glycosyltransferase family 4 protein [Candidatus Daviesbacteria bacterium]|nr:glycosyltransferase family 4 protein [Candidatus Daviesbacteria bacterium]
MRQKVQVILINGKNPLTKMGGYQTYTYNLAKILTSLGYRVKIFCFGAQNKTIQSDIGTIQTVYFRLFYLPLIRSVELTGLIFLAPILAWSIHQDLKNHPRKIVWGIGPWSLSAAMLKLIYPKLHYLSFYPTTFQHEFRGTLEALNLKDYGLVPKLEAYLAFYTIIPLYTLLERFFLKLADKIVIHYSSAQKILQEQFDIKDNQFIKIPDYSEPVKKPFKTQPKIPQLVKPFILLITRQDSRKGINFLLHAFAILNQRGIKYSAAIIGGGRMLQANRSLAQKLQLKNVYLPGFTTDPSYFLKKADVYVFSSVEEGSSAISILEAMQYGLPIVSTNVDGLVEDLEDKKSALLVPPKNPQALADAMQKLIQNPKLAKRLGKAAKKAFQAKHHLTKVKKELSSLIATYYT